VILATPPAQRSGNAARPIRRRWRGAAQTPYLFLAPTVITLALVFVLPVAYGIWASFQADGTAAAGGRWVGIQNYRAALSSPTFRDAVVVSVLFTMASVAGSYLAGLGAALLLHQRFPGRTLIGGALIVPWAMPFVVAAVVWSWLFDFQYGLFNYLVQQIGLTAGRVGWLTDPRVALWSVTVVQVWKLFPLGMVMLLAGLKSIPPDLYEAARVDGAGHWRSFISITLPGLSAISLVLILLQTIWAFGRSFTAIFVMTGGGPAGATETLVIRTFLEGFRFFHLELASALGVIILLISAAFAAVYFWSLGRDR
jgi:multiple sugar transport system permease protein